MSTVTCVRFNACGHQWALEAHHVRRIDSAAMLARYVSFETLMCRGPGHSSRWLTLIDRQGPWQLGLPGDSELVPLQVADLHPLPPLLAARTSYPALCGIALEGASMTFLLEGGRLGLPVDSDSVD